MKYTVFILFIGLLVAQCTSRKSTDPETEFRLVETPVGEKSGQPQLFTDSMDRLWLSWVEPLESGGHQLLYSRYDGNVWTEPVEAARGEKWFVNWADLPGVKPLPDGSLIAWYLVSNSDSVYGYDIHFRVKPPSNDWGDVFMPHSDGTPTQHGFVSVDVLDDSILSVWLDGRETVEKNTDKMNNHSHGHGEEGAMTLRAVKMSFDGTLQEKMLIDGHVCSCCPTTMVAVPGGILTAYRNRTQHEIRDIYVSKFDGTRWTEPANVHKDDWKITACPVNGPTLASHGSVVSVAWYTGAADKHAVKVAFSEDEGTSFSTSILIDDNKPTGRAGVVMPNERTAFVSWQGMDRNNKPALMTTTVGLSEGKSENKVAVFLPDSMPPVTPKLTMTSSHFYLAWIELHTETGHPQVKLAEKKRTDTSHKVK